MNPARKRNRTRHLRPRLAAAPVAFAGTEHAHRIDERDRMRRKAARLLDASDTESLALTLGVEPMTYLHAFGSTTRDGTLTVTTPARDSRGRRNPRMRPSSYSV